MKVSLSQIKSWFKKGMYPTESQFANTFDSFWHKDDTLPLSAIQNLMQILNGKADAEAEQYVQIVTDESDINNLSQKTRLVIVQNTGILYYKTLIGFQKISTNNVLNVEHLDDLFGHTLDQGIYNVLSNVVLDVSQPELPESGGIERRSLSAPVISRKKASTLYVSMSGTLTVQMTLISDDGIATCSTVDGIQKWVWKKWTELGGSVCDVTKEDLATKQNITDETLHTSTKTIVGAINEVLAIKAPSSHSHTLSDITDLSRLSVYIETDGQDEAYMNDPYYVNQIVSKYGFKNGDWTVGKNSGCLWVYKDGSFTNLQVKLANKQDATSDTLNTTNKTIVGAINEIWGTLKELWNRMTDYLKGIYHVTWEELKELRDTGKLVPGHRYRITDYVTTVANDPEARSAGHPFDLLVVATDVDTLSEEARVIKSLRKDMTPARFYSPSMGAWFVRDETNDGIYNGEQLYAWRSAGEYAFTKKLIPEDNADVFVAFDTDGNGWGTLYSIETLENFNEIGEELGDVINSNEYFADANLNAWKVWYCLDNDDTRYKWADTENGKGVIWRMIDECGNDCPYDFKNVQFKRYAILGITSSKLTEDAISYLQSALCYDQNGGRCFATKDVYGNWVPLDVDGTNYEIDETLFEWYYTFHSLSSHDGETIMDSYDMSTRPFKILDECIKYYKEDDCGMDSKDECHDNIIKPAYQEYDQDDEYFKGRLVLNNIVFLNGLSYCYYNDIDEYWEYCSGYCYGNVFGVECKNNTFGNYCYYNTFGNDFWNNTFGNNCYYNTFGNNCCYNTFGNYCSYNTFGNNCCDNTFGNYFQTNTFGNNCWGNTFGNNCYDNTFGNYCYYNTFGNYCSYNTFGNDCYRNTFGNNCYDNTFGNNCWGNTFGNNCCYNTFGNSFQANTFGNNCWGNTFGNDCYWNTFGNNVRYLTVHDGVQCVAVTGGSNNSYVQYAQILNGTRGQDSNNRLQISFQSNVNYCQFAGQNSSGILKIWVPADAA